MSLYKKLIRRLRRQPPNIDDLSDDELMTMVAATLVAVIKNPEALTKQADAYRGAIFALTQTPTTGSNEQERSNDVEPKPTDTLHHGLTAQQRADIDACDEYD